MKFFRLLPALFLLGSLAACGTPESPETTPETAPAPDPASAEEIQAAPFQTYFDLSGLSQETLTSALQNIDQERTMDGITVRVHQTMGDGQTILYAALDVIYPDNALPDSPPLPSASLGASPITGMTSIQTEDGTFSYMACFSQIEEPFAGQEVEFQLAGIGDTPYAFTWTAENSAVLQETEMLDKDGQQAGSAQLTPFSLTVRMDDTSINGFEEDTTIALLDQSGTPLPETWSISGDFSFTYFEFFQPMEPGTIQTVQLGPYTGQFS